MKKEKYTLTEKSQLSAQNAAKIVALCKEYTEEKIIFHSNDRLGDAHSLFNIINLEAKQGDELLIEVEGPKEEKVIKKIINTLKELEI
jgi:PTS HPr component phosphorylation site